MSPEPRAHLHRPSLPKRHRAPRKAVRTLHQDDIERTNIVDPVQATHWAFSSLGQLIAAGGGGAIVAYGIFKYLGKGWIENQLARDLEAAKSEISLLAARKMKLYDQEYVVFPLVWTALNRAYSSLGSAVISFREMPDFNRMEAEKFQNWAERSDLSENEKSYLLSETDKTKAYSRILDYRALNQANRDFVDYHVCLQENRIFLSPDVKEKLDTISGLLRSAWAAKKMDLDGHRLDGKSFMIEAFEKYEKEAKPIMKEVEELVQGKIFPPARYK